MNPVPYNIPDESNLFLLTQFPPHIQDVMGAPANDGDFHDPSPISAA